MRFARHHPISSYLRSSMELRRRIVKLPLLPQCIPFWCVQAFEIVRPGEAESFRNVGNRMLLWHGSRITNWAGILSQVGVCR